MTNIFSRFKSRAALLAMVSFFGLGQAALAAPCTAEIDALQTVLNEDVCPLGKACNGLSNKLENAKTKAEKGEYRKAAHKLADFGRVVQKLGDRKDKGKNWHRVSQLDSSAVEQMMSTYYVAAVACVNDPEGSVAAPPVEEPLPDNSMEEVY